jgi:hypothetical protein
MCSDSEDMSVGVDTVTDKGEQEEIAEAEKQGRGLLRILVLSVLLCIDAQRCWGILHMSGAEEEHVTNAMPDKVVKLKEFESPEPPR